MCITFFATFMSCIFGIILLGLKLSEFIDISKAHRVGKLFEKVSFAHKRNSDVYED